MCVRVGEIQRQFRKKSEKWERETKRDRENKWDEQKHKANGKLILIRKLWLLLSIVY